MRLLTVPLDIGERDCRECPFRALDWNFGKPTGAEHCTHPSWQSPEITGGVRHSECLAADGGEA